MFYMKKNVTPNKSTQMKSWVVENEPGEAPRKISLIDLIRPHLQRRIEHKGEHLGEGSLDPVFGPHSARQ
jgi:hypothetical protein